MEQTTVQFATAMTLLVISVIVITYAIRLDATLESYILKIKRKETRLWSYHYFVTVLNHEVISELQGRESVNIYESPVEPPSKSRWQRSGPDYGVGAGSRGR